MRARGQERRDGLVLLSLVVRDCIGARLLSRWAVASRSASRPPRDRAGVGSDWLVRDPCANDAGTRPVTRSRHVPACTVIVDVSRAQCSYAVWEQAQSMPREVRDLALPEIDRHA